MVRSIAFIIVFVLFLYDIHAQVVPAKVVQSRVLDYYKELQKLTSPKKGKAYKFSFIQSIEAKDENSFIKSKVDYVVNTYFRSIKTDDIEIYQDSVETYVVVHKTKSIMLANTPPKPKIEKQVKDVLNLIPYDMVETADVFYLTPSGNDADVYIIGLKVNDKYREKTELNKLTFWVNLKSGKISKLKAEFLETFKMKTLIIEYKEINLDYKCPGYIAKNYVFRNKKILPIYKNYQLVVDNK